LTNKLPAIIVNSQVYRYLPHEEKSCDIIILKEGRRDPVTVLNKNTPHPNDCGELLIAASDRSISVNKNFYMLCFSAFSYCTVEWVDIGTRTKVPQGFVTYLSKTTKINEKSVLTQ
jgi:hypothetical protein